MVQASTRPDDWVLDFFAGSGTLGAAAMELNRRFVLVDESPDAIKTMRARLVGDSLFRACPDFLVIDPVRVNGDVRMHASP